MNDTSVKVSEERLRAKLDRALQEIHVHAMGNNDNQLIAYVSDAIDAVTELLSRRSPPGGGTEAVGAEPAAWAAFDSERSALDMVYISEENLDGYISIQPDAFRARLTKLPLYASPPLPSGDAKGMREATPDPELIEAIINGTAPMSKWVASVDYSTYDGFEEYLKSQLREKLTLKVSLDKKRHESPEDESLATFVDGSFGALESALNTFRVVRQRVRASLHTEPAGEGDGATLTAVLALGRWKPGIGGDVHPFPMMVQSGDGEYIAAREVRSILASISSSGGE